MGPSRLRGFAVVRAGGAGGVRPTITARPGLNVELLPHRKMSSVSGVVRL